MSSLLYQLHLGLQVIARLALLFLNLLNKILNLEMELQGTVISTRKEKWTTLYCEGTFCDINKLGIKMKSCLVHYNVRKNKHLLNT